MGIINRLFNFTPGTAIDSEQVDAELNQIVGLTSGNLDLTNVATALKNAFLKLAVAADRKIAFGLDANAPAGASWGISPETTGVIAHGLGATPSYVFLTAGTAVSTASGASVVAASVVSVDGTNINYKLRTVDGGNCNFPAVKLYWAAVS